MSRICRIIACMFLIAPAVFAQNSRSAVASTGLDTNPCTVASPCRSFTAAIAHTNSHGEIIALESAGYRPFSVGKEDGSSRGIPA